MRNKETVNINCIHEKEKNNLKIHYMKNYHMKEGVYLFSIHCCSRHQNLGV